MSAEGTVADVLAGRARYAVVCGDAVEALRALPDGCAHVAYCDPPYGLSAQSTGDVVECLRAWLAGEVYTHGRGGIMGHEWDSFVPGPEAWREVHRALRPGGYCVAFSSTRTVDLLGIAVRLAGFEMREGWAWAFSASMPKGLNVGKAIDAAEGAEREVIGQRVYGDGHVQRSAESIGYGGSDPTLDTRTVTAPATEAAAQWEGYNTAVKPGYEPLVVARKPLDGTVAHNVTTHGCGALNIDAARISAGGASPSVARRESAARSGWDNRGGGIMDDRTDPARYAAPHAGEQLGRFPAALALVHSEGCELVGTRRVRGFKTPVGHTSASTVDVYGDFAKRSTIDHTDADGMETCDEWVCEPGCAVAELARQSGESASSDRPRRNAARGVTHAKGAESDHVTGGFSDSGTAARFFWQAKAAASDRLAYVTCAPGCAAHETVIGAREARASATCPTCGGARTKHEHSTVKALDLARYHARLLSLPAHVAPLALVPYCGSGPEARALLEVGFRVIAVDLDARHCAMTRHRLAQPLDATAPQTRTEAPAAPVVVAPVATSPIAAPRPARRQPAATAQLDLFSPPPKDRA